jgi:peptidoglycan/LPS O-acetylase OafA/YrhL
MANDNTSVGTAQTSPTPEIPGSGQKKAGASKQEFYEFLRGLAVISVPACHTMGATDYSHDSANALCNIVLRQILYLSIPTFLFISGYFSVSSFKKSPSVWVYYGERLKRLLVPYIVWSLVGVFAKWVTGTPVSIKAVFYWLGTGQAVYAYYYFIVLFQLILLTPLLMRWKDGRITRFVPIIIGLGSVSVLTMMRFTGFGHFKIVDTQLPFVYWIMLYQVGILMRGPAESAWVKAHSRGLGFAYVGALLLSIVISLCLWTGVVHDRVAIMQLTPWTTAAGMLLVLFLFGRFSDGPCVSRLVMRLGNYSFGIYLIHFLGIMQLANMLCRPVYDIQPLFVALSTVLTLAACIGIIEGVRRIIGDSRAWILGF